MALKVHAARRIELRWRWEGAAQGEAVVFRSPIEARSYLAAIGAVAELRAFLRRGTPGLWSPLADREVLDRLSFALAAGRLTIAENPRDALTSWGAREEGEDRPAAPIARALEAPPPVEEACVPCGRAAQSARALRDASRDATPFIANM